MNEHVDFERTVAGHIAVEGASPPADAFYDQLLLRASRSRQRPEWLALIKEPPMRVSARVAVGSPIVRVASLMILVTILSVLTASGMAVGATLLASPSPSGPLTLVVAQDDTGDFTTITEAIAVARDGDTVSVRPGTYRESVSISTDIVVVGDGPAGSVVIEFAADGPTVVTTMAESRPYGVRLEDSDAHIANLTVTGPNAAAGVWVSGGAPTLHALSVVLTGEDLKGVPLAFDFTGGSTATLTDSTGDWMIAIGGGASPTIEGLVQDGGGFIRGTGTSPVIRGSTFAFALDIDQGAEATIEGNVLLGLAISTLGTVVIRDNTFQNPDFVAGAAHDSSEEITAIEVQGGAPLIVGNRIRDHEVGISVPFGSTPTIEDNRIEANTTGILVTGSATPVLTGNTFCDNGTDLSVPAGSAVTLAGNTVCGAKSSSTP